MRGSSRSPPQHQPPPPPPPESPLSFRAASEANTAVKQLHLRSPPPSPPSTPPQAHTSLRRSDSLSGSRSLSHTVETAAGTSPASASGTEAERKQSADRKEKVEAGADAESDATSLQQRLYKPEVRSCGHPQPLYLRVPVERKQQKQQQQHQMRREEEGDAASVQRSPVVSKEQRSVLYLATPPNPSVSAAPAAAAGVRLQEDSPVSHAARQEGQAIAGAHTYTTPGRDNAARVVMSAVPPASVPSSFTSSTPSVPLQRHSASAPFHVNEKESTRGTNNAGVYAVESARVSAATESLAEQPLPSLPDATSLAPHHTAGHSNSGGEGREEEEGKEEDRMQTVAVAAEAPAGGAATAQHQASPQSMESEGRAAAVEADDDDDEQHGEGSSAVQEAPMMPQPYMPSSVTVRRFNHLRASDSSASSDSLHAAAAAPSETERTIDVDPPLTEHADTHGDDNNASQSEDRHPVTAAMAAAAASSPPSPALLCSAASSANHDDREENVEVEKEEEDDDGTAAFSSAFNRHRTGEGNNADDGERSDGVGHRWSQPSHLRQSSYHDHPFHSDATSLVDLTLESATVTTDRTGQSAQPEALPQTREEMTELPHSAAEASALTSRHGHLLLYSSDSSSSSSSSSEEVVGKHTTVNTTRAAAAAAAGVSATLSDAREASDVEELEEISDRDVMEADDDDVDDQEAEGSEDEAQSDAQSGASSPAAATAGETDHTEGLEHKKDEKEAHAPPHFPSPTTTTSSSSASSVSRELAVRESDQLPPETGPRRQHGDSDASHMSIPSSSSASHHAPLYGPQSPLSPQAGFFHNLVEVLSANSSASLGAGSPLHVTSPQLISASGFNRLDSLYTIQHSHTGGSIGAASTSALALDLLAVHHHANAVLNVPPSADDPLAALRATAMTTTGAAAAAAAAVTDSVSQRRYTGGESDFSIMHSVEGTDLSGPLDRIVMEPEDRSVSPEGGVQTAAEKGSGGWLDALEKVPSQSATVITTHHHHQQQQQPIDPHPLQHQQADHEEGQRGWQAQELDVSAPRSSADEPNERAELGALLRDKKERVLSSLTTRRAKAIPPPLLYESSTPHPFHRSNDTNNSCSDSDPRTTTLTVAALASAAAAAAAAEEEVIVPASQYHPDTGPLAWSGDREASLRSSRRVTEIYPDSVSYTTAVSFEAPQVPDRMVEQDVAEPPRQVPTPHEDAHKEEAAAAVLENTERVGEASREEEMRMEVGVNSDVDSASTFASDITAGLDAPAEGADAAVVKADGSASDVAAEGEEKGQPAVSSLEQGSGGGGGRDASTTSPSSSSSASVFSAPHVVAEHRRAAGDADDGHLLPTSEKSDGSVGVRVERQRDACNGEADDGGAATVATVATSRQPTDPQSVAAHAEVAKVTNLTPTTATTTAAAAPPPSPPSFPFPSHVTHTVDAYSCPRAQAAGTSPLHTLLGVISARTPRASLSSSPAAAAQTAVRRPTARELLDEEVEELSEVEFQEYAANSGEGGGEAGQQQEGWSSGGGAHDGVSVANRTAVVAEAETAQRLVEHARATVAAADLRVLVDVEREGRQRLLLEMLDERAMILRDETAAFTVLSLMTRHTPERETAARTVSPPWHHLQNNNSNPTSPSASSSQQQQQGKSGSQRKVRTSVQLLLPPSPPAPTSREEVQALLRTRGVPDGVSLHVVRAAVMTDELLHRELIEEHEVQTRTLLRRLRQCVLDALWPTHLVAQEALARQSIVEDARCEAQRIRSRESTVEEEIAGLRSVARELALCRMAEEEERSDVIARAEVAGRQRLRDLHLIGLAERLRQSAALMTVAAAAPASAQLRSELDDVCFDEAQEREEVRVAAIRAWTAVVTSPSGAAVRAFLAQQQQNGGAQAQMPYQHEKPRLASRATTPATAAAAGKTESEDTHARLLGKAPHAAREDEGEENAQAAAQHSQSSSTSSSSSPSSSSSSSSVSLSVASSVSFESIDHEPAMPEDTVDDGPQFFQWDPTSNSAPTPHDSNSRPSASRNQGSHRAGDHQQQQQHSTSSPSPHLTNMTTLTNTANTTATTTSSINNNKSHHDNTTATPSASVLLQGKSHEDADEKEERRRKKKKRSSTGLSVTTSSSGGKAAAAAVTSLSSQQRSPTLVLPTAERLGNRDAISAAEASALLHALRRAEEDARELRQQKQQRSSRHAAAKAVKTTDDSLSHQQQQQKDEEESSGAILDATMSDEKEEGKEGGVDTAGESKDRAALLHAHTGTRSAHRAPTPPTPPPSSSCFISRHSVPCSLRHSPSQSYRALLRKYSPSPGHPHSEAHDDSHHHTGNNNNKDDVQPQQRASPRLWAGRHQRSSSVSSTSPRRYADADVYRYDPATTAGARLPTAGSRRHSASAQRRAAAVRVPWDRSVRIDPLIQNAEPLEPEPLTANDAATKRCGVVRSTSARGQARATAAAVDAPSVANTSTLTVMPTPAREVFPPLRTGADDTTTVSPTRTKRKTMVKGNNSSGGQTHSPSSSMMMLHEQSTPQRVQQQQQQQPSLIEVITDSCIPRTFVSSSLHDDVSVSPLTSHRSPSRSLLGYAAPTEAWQSQTAQRQTERRVREALQKEQEEMMMMTTYEKEKREEGDEVDEASMKVMMSHARSTPPSSHSGVYDNGDTAGWRRSRCGHSRRRSPETAGGPLLITRLPFDHGPGVWPSPLYDRDLYQVENPSHTHHRTTAQMSKEESGRSSRQQRHHHQHVVATTRPSHSSAQRTRGVTSAPSAAAAAALEDALAQVVRTGEVVRLPTTVAALISGPMHTRLPLSTLHTTHDEGDSDNGAAVLWRDGSDGNASGGDDNCDYNRVEGEEVGSKHGRSSQQRQHPLVSPAPSPQTTSRSSYSYVDVFYRQPHQAAAAATSSPRSSPSLARTQQERRRMSESPNTAVRLPNPTAAQAAVITAETRFIEDRCAAVQELEAKHRLRMLLQPQPRRSARVSTAGAVGEEGEEEESRARKSDKSGFLYGQRTQRDRRDGLEGDVYDSASRLGTHRQRDTASAQQLAEEAEDGESYFDHEDVILCSAMASCALRQRTSAQQQQHKNRQPRQQHQQYGSPSHAMGRSRQPPAQQRIPPPRQQQQQRASTPSSSSPPSSRLTSGFMDVDVPPGYRVLPAPSPSYLLVRTPSPAAAPSSAQPSARGWIDAPTPPSPAHVHATAGGIGPVAGSANPYTTRGLYFDTSKLQRKINGA